MPEHASLPPCPKCHGPTFARHAGSDDGVRAAWAECRNVECGERVSITFAQWLETFRPREAKLVEPLLLTTVGDER